MVISAWSWRRGSGMAAGALRTSGVIGGVGFVLLVGMYAAFAAGARSTGMTLGWLNDVTGVVTLPLAVPGMVALHARLRPHGEATSDVLLAIGVGTATTISGLQLLLVTGALPFERQVGPVTVSYLVLATWFVVTGRMAARAGLVPDGTRLGVRAAIMAGYPIWAFRIARTIESPTVMLGEPGAG